MLESAAKLGKYTIIERIGAGGMADVYLAKDTVLKRNVAMKILPPEFSRDPERVLRFEKEVRNLAALSHPNIVTVYDVGCDDGYHYYTMELLSGGDLKQRIQQGLTPVESLDIFKQIADALRFAHSKGLIHRDIKPKNILFDDEQRPLLTDLGIAKAIGSNTHMTKTGMIIGTPHYMSPEQARGKTVDHRSDLYSLGVVFYEMLTGSVPYEAEDTFAIGYMHINDPTPMLPSSFSEYQPFIDRLMAKHVENRFVDAGELLSCIVKVQYGEQLPRPDFTVSSVALERNYPESYSLTDSETKILRPPKIPNWFLGSVIGLLIVLIITGLYIIFLLLSPVPGDHTAEKRGQSESSASSLAGSDAQSSKSTADQKEPSSSLKDNPPEASLSAGQPADSFSQEHEDLSRADFYRQKEIQRLLALAETNFKAQRLTSPKGGSAYDRYKEVLALDDKNEQARQGMVLIVNRYIELADNALDREKFDQAADYLASASTVIPEDEAIAAAHKRLAAAREDIQQRYKILAQKNEAAKRADFDAKMTMGNEALADHDKKTALLAYQEALTLYPDDESAQAGLEKARSLKDVPKHGDTLTNLQKMTFVYIGSGKFHMGSSESDSDRDSDELLHKVTLIKGYWLQTTEVTQGQWKMVMGENPSRFSDCGDNCPVENVSWQDTHSFIAKLNSSDSKLTYRLPTEAEWEYAARAGSESKFCFGNSAKTLSNYGWYDSNADNKTHPVAGKKANAWGLYDMHGNVWEWCQDWYGDYPTGAIVNPTGPLTGRNRVFRGGSWFSGYKMCRSAVRQALSQENRNFYLGLRLAASLKASR